MSPGPDLNQTLLLQKQVGPGELPCSHAGSDHFTQHVGTVIALFNGTRQPVKRFGIILFNTPALCINQPYAILRINIAPGCCL